MRRSHSFKRSVLGSHGAYSCMGVSSSRTPDFSTDGRSGVRGPCCANMCGGSSGGNLSLHVPCLTKPGAGTWSANPIWGIFHAPIGHSSHGTDRSTDALAVPTSPHASVGLRRLDALARVQLPGTIRRAIVRSPHMGS